MGLAEAEVAEARRAALIEDHVLRLDVAVHDPALVEGLQPAGDLDGDLEGDRCLQRTFAEDLVEGLSGDEVHVEKGQAVEGPRVADRDQVRVLEAQEHALLPGEASGPVLVLSCDLGVEDLDRAQLSCARAAGVGQANALEDAGQAALGEVGHDQAEPEERAALGGHGPRQRVVEEAGVEDPRLGRLGRREGPSLSSGEEVGRAEGVQDDVGRAALEGARHQIFPLGLDQDQDGRSRAPEEPLDSAQLLEAIQAGSVVAEHDQGGRSFEARQAGQERDPVRVNDDLSQPSQGFGEVGALGRGHHVAAEAHAFPSPLWPRDRLVEELISAGSRDGGEGRGVEGRAADQGPATPRESHQLGRVVRLDAPPVEHGWGGAPVAELRHEAAAKVLQELGDLGPRGGQAGPDRPARLVGHGQAPDLARADLLAGHLELAAHDGLGSARLAFLEGLPDAEDGLELGVQRDSELAGHEGVVLAGVAPLAVTDDDPAAADLDQVSRRDLSRVRSLAVRGDVLGPELDGQAFVSQSGPEGVESQARGEGPRLGSSLVALPVGHHEGLPAGPRSVHATRLLAPRPHEVPGQRRQDRVGGDLEVGGRAQVASRNPGAIRHARSIGAEGDPHNAR